LGFVPVLTSVAVGGTHTINVKKAGIVKLLALTTGGQCSGTVVGVKPLTVLTAFHCIGHLENGDVAVALPNERKAMEASPFNYISTKAVVSPKLLETPEAGALKLIDQDIKAASAEIAEVTDKLKTDPENPALLEQVEELQSKIYSSVMMYQQGLMSVLTKGASEDASSDLAILVFDRYNGPLNQKNPAELIASGALIPISPSKEAQGTKVAFAGFGINGETRETPKEMGAFTNKVHVQAGNTLAIRGMLPGITDSLIAKGEMGAVLPGDSGGPLLNDFGVVGVASYIKNSPMEAKRPPAPGWPRDRDGYYSYLTGRFVDISSDRAAELFATAKLTQKVNLEQNYAENLALTDLSTWDKPEAAEPTLPTLPLEPPVLTQVSKTLATHKGR
jgi:hypothetical protein